MIELSKKMGLVTDPNPQGLQCKNCGLGIALGGDLSTLPQTFEATCPTCRETRTYQLAEIQTLQAHRKQ